MDQNEGKPIVRQPNNWKVSGGANLELARAEIGQGLVVEFPAVSHHSVGVVENNRHVSLLDVLVGQSSYRSAFSDLVEPYASPVIPLDIVGDPRKFEDLTLGHSDRQSHQVLDVFLDLSVILREGVGPRPAIAARQGEQS